MNKSLECFSFQFLIPGLDLDFVVACLEVNYGIISLFGPSEKTLDRMLESISSNLGVPYLSTAPRPELTSGLPESKLRISLYPTQSQMIGLVKDLALELQWKEASIIHDPVHGCFNFRFIILSLQKKIFFFFKYLFCLLQILRNPPTFTSGRKPSVPGSSQRPFGFS